VCQAGLAEDCANRRGCEIRALGSGLRVLCSACVDQFEPFNVKI